MKALLPFFAVLALASCKKEVSKADYDAKRTEIERITGSIAWNEEYLGVEKDPGQIALKTEQLRDLKSELDRVLNDKNSPIPYEEAKKIAADRRKTAAAEAAKNRKEFQAKLDDL